MKIVSCEEYANCFLDGNLYCNTVRYFREEGYDKLEGAFFIHPDTISLSSSHGSLIIPKEDLAASVIVQPDQVADLNIFCMFSWRVRKVGGDKVLIDLESQLGSITDCIADFGPYTVVVTNTTEFFGRLDLAVKHGHCGILAGMRGVVRYIDPDTHHSQPAAPLEIPLFKQERFAHQQEYRFIFKTDREPAHPLVLPIGDIRDIAFCMRTEQVYDSVKVEDKVSPSDGN